jgi:hypothetical protein
LQQLFDNFLTTLQQLFDNFLTTFFTTFLTTFLTTFANFFFFLMVVAGCRNKYYGTNFISAVPTSLLIAPGLQTIQFLFFSLSSSSFSWTCVSCCCCPSGVALLFASSSFTFLSSDSCSSWILLPFLSRPDSYWSWSGGPSLSLQCLGFSFCMLTILSFVRLPS